LDLQLEKAGCKPGNLRAIVLTHGDNDHVANAAFLRRKYQTIIAMHKDDIDLVQNVTLDKMMESFRYSSVVLKLMFVLMKKFITKVTAKAMEDFEKFSPDVILNDGDNLSAYGLDATIIHLPGHTPGSIGILMVEGNLIVGDTLANMKKPVPSPNACDFKQLKSSIKRLKAMKLKTIYPGHGNCFEAVEI